MKSPNKIWNFKSKMNQYFNSMMKNEKSGYKRTHPVEVRLLDFSKKA